MNIRSIEPKWGENYNLGYAMFTMRAGSLVSQGIAYFEGYSPKDAIRPTHVAPVTGEDEVIEATPKGVVRASLKAKFEDPGLLVFFKRPVHYTPALAAAIVDEAEQHLGEHYGYTTLIAHALAKCWLGRLVNKVTHDKVDNVVSGWLDNEHKLVCSGLEAHVLKRAYERVGEQPMGNLQLPERMADPRELFDDPMIFEPWKQQRLVTSPSPCPASLQT